MENTLFWQAFKWPIDGLIGLSYMIYLFYLFNQPEMRCDEQSIAYEYARSLSEARLERIYLDLKRDAEQGITHRGDHTRRYEKPAEFSDLQYTRLLMNQHDIERGEATMRLNFCIDQSIDLEIEGINDGQAKIKLTWGEVERKEEVLWQSLE